MVKKAGDNSGRLTSSVHKPTKGSINMPISCANGCGYFRTAENRNMCSVCYKEFLKREIMTASSKPTVVTVDQPAHHHVSSSSASGKDIVVSQITAQSGRSTGRKIRCKSCNRKMGLTGFRCRCGDLFCGMHRLPDAHECNVDYKTVRGRNDGDLAEIIKGDKLEWRV